MTNENSDNEKKNFDHIISVLKKFGVIFLLFLLGCYLIGLYIDYFILLPQV